jgi:beta-lactamase superfamily II metal-dependent hydrolase
MDLEIFDVEHGACALLTCDNGTRLMIDCGHNGDTRWRPGTYLCNQGIRYLDMLAITNYDEDHVSGLPDLLGNVDVGWLWRNQSVSPETIEYLKSEDGMGRGIKALVNMTSTSYTGGADATPPAFLAVERQSFCNNYPNFDDENNLNMVVHLSIAGINFLFPGDLESSGWDALLKQPDFQRVVSNTHVLIASHHGRESGICTDIFDTYGCHPFYVIISEGLAELKK